MSGQIGGSHGMGPAAAPLYSPTRALESPYLDFATKSVPRSFSDVIDWSEHVATLSDDLGMGLRRLYTYFCTPVDVGAYDLQEKEYEVTNSLRWELLLRQNLDYLNHATQLGMNVGVYGNDFVTITLKHQRMAVCPRCSRGFLVRDVKEYPGTDLRFENMVFSGNCLSDNCRGRGRVRYELQHHYDRSADNIVIKHWPIRELEFDYMETIDELQVYWRIPNRIRQKVLKDQDPQTLHDLDLGTLEAICRNQLLQFDDRVMFHAKEPHLSGLENRGLGIPRTLPLARQHWLVQLLKKQCQALSYNYVTPMKFFSMGQGAGMQAMDPVQQVDARLFRTNVEEMIASHQKDPNRNYVLPFPIQFQYAGGGADQFVPAGLIQLASQDLSNSLVPLAMLRGDLNAQGGPMFLRMFEAFNREIPAMYNRFLSFTVARTSELLKTSAVGCVHQSAAVADNVGVDSILMQAANMGKASDYVWMRRLGLNPRTESNRMLAEARSSMEMQKKMQDMQEETGFADLIKQQATQGLASAAQDPAMAQQQAVGPGGAPAPGGAPGMPGLGLLLPSQGYQPPQDIMQMESEAAQMAATLGGLEQSQRNQELGVLRQGSPAFHSLVTAELEKLRDQVATEGRQTLMPTL